MSLLNSLAVAYDSADLALSAQALSLQLNVPLIVLSEPLKRLTQFDYLLLLTQDGIAIAKTGKGAPNPVRVDFVSGAAAHRRKFGGGKGQDIAKAVGLNKRPQLTLLDATAGLGRDAFVLATLGCHVTLLERVPFVRALLSDGLERAQGESEISDIIERIELAQGVLGDQAEAGFDVVYLDPMFPHVEKSAAAKKEMAFFRDLIGHDADADALLPYALACAKYRVVVKRPKGAPFLNGQTPTYQLEGKSGRFDVYVLQSLDHREPS